MPVVKPISGHTGCGGIMRYLTKGGRALAVDLSNLSWSPEHHCGFRDWAEEMDFTRVAYGNHTPWRGRPVRTYKHYVLSPDPRDGISLEALRDLARAWVAENFEGFQAAIVYHDDNEGRVMHAHVVVNNTNLETGARLQDPAPRELMRSAQRLAEERGLSFFLDAPAPGAAPLLAAREGARREGVHFRRAERELLEKGGYSWVADIRCRVTVARRVARDEADFIQVLSELGVEVSDAAPRGGEADWVYALAGEGARRIRGGNLGTSFGRESVLQELALRSAPSRAEAIRESARGAVEVDDLDDLRRLADALDAFSREGVRSLADCEARISALEAVGDFEAMERLAGHRDYAAEKGLLPERAPARRRRIAPDDGSPRQGGRRRPASEPRWRGGGEGRARDGRESQR